MNALERGAQAGAVCASILGLTGLDSMPRRILFHGGFRNITIQTFYTAFSTSAPIFITNLFVGLILDKLLPNPIPTSIALVKCTLNCIITGLILKVAGVANVTMLLLTYTIFDPILTMVSLAAIVAAVAGVGYGLYRLHNLWETLVESRSAEHERIRSLINRATAFIPNNALQSLTGISRGVIDLSIKKLTLSCLKTLYIRDVPAVAAVGITVTAVAKGIISFPGILIAGTLCYAYMRAVDYTFANFEKHLNTDLIINLVRERQFTKCLALANHLGFDALQTSPFRDLQPLKPEEIPHNMDYDCPQNDLPEAGVSSVVIRNRQLTPDEIELTHEVQGHLCQRLRGFYKGLPFFSMSLLHGATGEFETVTFIQESYNSANWKLICSERFSNTPDIVIKTHNLFFSDEKFIDRLGRCNFNPNYLLMAHRTSSGSSLKELVLDHLTHRQAPRIAEGVKRLPAAIPRWDKENGLFPMEYWTFPTHDGDSQVSADAASLHVRFVAATNAAPQPA